MIDIVNAETFDTILEKAIAMNGMDIHIKMDSDYINARHRKSGEWHNLMKMTPELFGSFKRDILGLIARHGDYFDDVCCRVYISRNIGEYGLVRVRLESFQKTSDIEFFMSLMLLGDAITPELIDIGYSVKQQGGLESTKTGDDVHISGNVSSLRKLHDVIKGDGDVI